jgi:hypothetical protein
VGAAASFVMLALFFSPQLVLGLAIDLALLWLVFASRLESKLDRGTHGWVRSGMIESS